MAARKELPLPPHYDPKNCLDWNYGPNNAALFESAAKWQKAHGIRASAAQRTKVVMLGIDFNKDFCFPEGTLYVAGRSGTGALDDNRTVTEFIYRNLDVITDIIPTFDTHFPFQIFFASFLVDSDGNHPPVHTFVTTEDVLSGKLRINPKIAQWAAGGNLGWAQKQLEFYCRELEKAGKYKLYMWPFHCLLGTPGHALVGTIMEAMLYHAWIRCCQLAAEVKGGNPWTENYSIMRPEVLMFHDGRPMAQKNTRLIKTLVEADAVVVDGQAATHCVASSTDDFLTEINAVDPALAQKVYVGKNGMSSVVVRDPKGNIVADFTPQADAAFARWADAGMHLVDLNTPIESWPGIRL